MKHFKLKVHLVTGEIFQYALITYLILLLAETLQAGFVSYFFNLNILLGVILASGVVMVLTHNEQLDPPPAARKINASDVQYIILFAVGGAMLVYYKTKMLGQIGTITAILTGIIIILLSLLVFFDNKK